LLKSIFVQGGAHVVFPGYMQEFNPIFEKNSTGVQYMNPEISYPVVDVPLPVIAFLCISRAHTTNSDCYRIPEKRIPANWHASFGETGNSNSSI